MEASGQEPELASALFARQQGLTRNAVFAIATPFMPPEKLAACLASPATRAALDQDLAAAAQFDSDGTPIVAVNGRRGTSFGPFLYAMILTRGNAEHPAFAALPPGTRAPTCTDRGGGRLLGGRQLAQGRDASGSGTRPSRSRRGRPCASGS